MSYIRALGNPEHLYIIGTSDGQVEIFGRDDRPSLLLPRAAFHGVLTRWLDSAHDLVRYKGAEMRECQGFDHFTLRYKTWPKGIVVKAWMVTWAYIAQGIIERERFDKESKQKKRKAG